MIKSPFLDICCGGKMFYLDKHDNRILSVSGYKKIGDNIM